MYDLSCLVIVSSVPTPVHVTVAGNDRFVVVSCENRVKSRHEGIILAANLRPMEPVKEGVLPAIRDLIEKVQLGIDRAQRVLVAEDAVHDDLVADVLQPVVPSVFEQWPEVGELLELVLEVVLRQMLHVLEAGLSVGERIISSQEVRACDRCLLQTEALWAVLAEYCADKVKLLVPVWSKKRTDAQQAGR